MFTEDMTAFFNASEFAVAATYNGSTTIYGNFNAPYAAALDVAGTNPTFECAASDVPASGVGNPLAVNSVTYKIRNRMPQDDGAWVVLELEKQ